MTMPLPTDMREESKREVYAGTPMSGQALQRSKQAPDGFDKHPEGLDNTPEVAGIKKIAAAQRRPPGGLDLLPEWF